MVAFNLPEGLKKQVGLLRLTVIQKDMGIAYERVCNFLKDRTKLKSLAETCPMWPRGRKLLNDQTLLRRTKRSIFEDT